MSTQASVEREIRALRRWHLRRRAVWVALARTWLLALVLVVAGSVLVGSVLGSDPWLLLGPWLAVGAVTIFLLDAALVPWRAGRMFRSIVMAQSPPGTALGADVGPDRFVLDTPDTSFAISTDAMTRLTWVEGCLVIDTRTDKFFVVPGELLDDHAWSVLETALGDRLRRV